MPVSADSSTQAVTGSGEAVAREREIVLQVALASVRFILDVEEADRADRGADLVDGLIFAAVVAANVAPLARDPALEKAYSAVHEPPPAHLRRPVSISAVAHSVRMPFETVRRRVRGMVRRGALADAPSGVFVPDPVLRDERVVRAMATRHARVGAFYREIQAMGVLPAAAAAPVADDAPPPIRISNRATWQYVLRAVDALMAITGDAVKAFLLLGMVRENIEGLSLGRAADWARDPLGHARPVRTGTLANRLNLSPETCRRHAIGLEVDGFCVRTGRGLVACAPPAARTSLDQAIRANFSNIQRMFATLAQLGVLETWDDARPRSTSAQA